MMVNDMRSMSMKKFFDSWVCEGSLGKSKVSREGMRMWRKLRSRRHQQMPGDERNPMSPSQSAWAKQTPVVGEHSRE
jgi:hypothetical protein